MGKKIVACNMGTDNIPQFPNLENDDDKGNDFFFLSWAIMTSY